MPNGNISSKRSRAKNSHENKGHFGDLLKRKKTNNAILLLHNTGGIGCITAERSRKTLKIENMKNISITYDLDIVCLTEVNKD